ncbi:hypothetical protein [Companilactobacillus mishanensis]|uniref:Uncharacterized protein n=1 Tax=Companilactobacillus mishanensis TaxID=2486008 RepID=A0ABW9P443_9LACO|nr:hypothetical protein [Companilactobacillus mishanensis]MQS43932.1 hypothetical protein [Companilactobacillus mishanensis]
MNKVILDDFIVEFYRRYNKDTFNGLEVVNNDSMDTSSVFMKMSNGVRNANPIYSISPMNRKGIKLLLNEASKQLPFSGYFWTDNVTDNETDFVQLSI